MKNLEYTKLRPCLVIICNEGTLRKALFHGWYKDNDDFYAILEFEDGYVGLHSYSNTVIKFIDNPFAEYDWRDLKGETEDGSDSE